MVAVGRPGLTSAALQAPDATSQQTQGDRPQMAHFYVYVISLADPPTNSITLLYAIPQGSTFGDLVRTARLGAGLWRYGGMLPADSYILQNNDAFVFQLSPQHYESVQDQEEARIPPESDGDVATLPAEGREQELTAERVNGTVRSRISLPPGYPCARGELIVEERRRSTEPSPIVARRERTSKK